MGVSLAEWGRGGGVGRRVTGSEAVVGFHVVIFGL